MSAVAPLKIVPPYYPIVYVRGYAMTEGEREDVFHDAYYGFSATSVEKREAPPPKYFEVDIFEGQFIRLMKMRDYGYADAVNRGLRDFHDNPTRSIFVSRFYDRDYLGGTIRDVTKHAEELCNLIVGGNDRDGNEITDDVRTRLKKAKPIGCDFGPNDREFKVILVAHSMGGLVCRTLIQHTMRERGLDPAAWIHRLVTIGSPHGGIELGRVPDFIEQTVAHTVNPFNSGIFDPDNMRRYLHIPDDHDVRSLGQSGFPVKRCFCIIGSDYRSYNATKFVTGGFSDGLVKQDRAYVVQGQQPPAGERYKEENVAFGANVHRAHSGNRGIVNSYESYENLSRFLFGNLRADISLVDIDINVPEEKGAKFIYDFEFLASIKGTGVYLQRREQDPCENAIRFEAHKWPGDGIFFYTGFLRSSEKVDADSKFAEFALTLRVVEHRIQQGFLWDHEYPGRQIYNETLIIRVGDADGDEKDDVQILWLSDRAGFETIKPKEQRIYTIPLRAAASVKGNIRIVTGPWPDDWLTKDSAPSDKPDNNALARSWKPDQSGEKGAFAKLIDLFTLRRDTKVTRPLKLKRKT